MDFAKDSDNASKGNKVGAATLETSVLVVGAGPTGLLLASELQRRDVACHLIDARPGPMHWDRATIVHPRSLQIFDSLGLVDKLLDVGCRQRVIKIYSGGKHWGRLTLQTAEVSMGSILVYPRRSQSPSSPIISINRAAK